MTSLSILIAQIISHNILFSVKVGVINHGFAAYNVGPLGEDLGKNACMQVLELNRLCQLTDQLRFVSMTRFS